MKSSRREINWVGNLTSCRATLLIQLACLLPVMTCNDARELHQEKFIQLCEKAIQGEKYRFKFVLDSVDIQRYERLPLYASIQFISSLDSGSYKSYVLPLTESSEGEFTVPANISAFKIWLSTRDDWVHLYSSKGYIPVWKNPTTLMWEARNWMMYNLDEKNIHEAKSLFLAERSDYPDNLSIYANLWLMELRVKQLDADTLEKQIQEISAQKVGVLSPFLEFLGRAIIALNRSEKIQTIPLDMFSRKDNPAFESEAIISLLSPSLNRSERGDGPALLGDINDTMRIQILETIIENNPATLFTQRCFDDGTIRKVSPRFAIHAIDEILKREPSPSNMLKKAFILWKSFPERYEEAMSLTNSVIAVLENGDSYVSGIDPWHLLSLHKIEPYTLKGDLLASRKFYDSALAIVTKGRTMLDEPWNFRHAFALKHQADYLLKKGLYDSSTTYLCGALLYAPQWKEIRDSLQTRHKSYRGKKSLVQWVNSIQKNLPSTIYSKSKVKTTVLQLTTGALVSLEDQNDTVVIIEMWSTGCGLCNQNIKHLYKYLHTDGAATKIKVLIAPDKEDELRKFLKQAKVDFPIVKYGRKLHFEFSVRSYPETMIIFRGEVVRRVSGSFHLSDIELFTQM